MTVAFPKAELLGPQEGTLVFGEKLTRVSGYFGIYDTQKQPIKYCDVVSGGFTSAFDPSPNTVDVTDRLDMPCLFAGLATAQFGHVLLNALGRLWALDALPRETELIFTTKGAPNPARYKHIRTVLDALGIAHPIRVIKNTTRFANIYTASDQFGEAFGGRGSAFFYDWLDRRVPRIPSPTPGTKLYVARSGLGAMAGRFACETALEEMLIADGYDVFYPEQHSLTDQFMRYAQAEKLIFAEGSALHAFALVRRPSQQVAVIQRRRALPPLIATQMNDRPGPDVIVIDAIETIFWPPVRGDHFSVAVLDFDKLGRALRDANFIAQNGPWRVPKADVQQASLRAGLAADEKMLNAQERQVFLKQLRKDRQRRRAAAQN